MFPLVLIGRRGSVRGDINGYCFFKHAHTYAIVFDMALEGISLPSLINVDFAVHR